jgi:hypothetical protein
MLLRVIVTPEQRSKALADLDDIELALNKGIPANDETGQPELLAANDEECGYGKGCCSRQTYESYPGRGEAGSSVAERWVPIRTA